MATPISQALMHEGTLYITEEEVVILWNNNSQRKGWPTQTRIPVSSISHVEHTPCGFISNGVVQINVDEIIGVVLPENQRRITFTGFQRESVARSCGDLEKIRAALLNPALASVKGVNGQIELLQDRVRIKRQGGMAVLTQGLKGDKEIQLASISSIQLRAPGSFTNGYIQFAFHGGQEAKGALFQATSDENSVMFSSAQSADFQKMKHLIEQQRTKISAPTVSSASGLDDLEKLASLRDKGILTEEEFQAKKKQILGL